MSRFPANVEPIRPDSEFNQIKIADVAAVLESPNPLVAELEKKIPNTYHSTKKTNSSTPR